MTDFTECAGKYFRQPWKFAIAGRDKLVTDLSTYPSCTLYRLLTTFSVDMELLTSSWMLLPIIAKSGFTYFFKLCVLGDIFGGSFTVD